MAKFGQRKLMLEDGTVVDVVCGDRFCTYWGKPSEGVIRCPQIQNTGWNGNRCALSFAQSLYPDERGRECKAAERRYKAQEEATEHE